MATPVPVFAYPAELLFNANDSEHLKHMITIYNPYDFPIQYRILCTSPDLFTLRDCEGSVSAGHTIDIIVRLSPQVQTDTSTPIRSKFRVQVYDARTKTLVGRRDLLANVSYASLESSTPSLDLEQESVATTSGSLQRYDSTSAPATDRDLVSRTRSIGGYRGSGAAAPPPNDINYLAIIVGLICVFGLMLPGENEPSIHVPYYLHLSFNQKLIISFTLGLVTMVLLHP